MTRKTMKNGRVWFLLLTFVILGAAQAHAYVLDGDLSDWGVSIFSEYLRKDRS